MAKIPTYQASLSPSTQPGQAYLPRQPGTGAEQVGQALFGVGQNMENLAVQGARLNAQREAEAARQQAEEERKAELSQRIQADQDKSWAVNATTRYQTRVTEREIGEQQNMPAGGIYEDKSTYVDKVKTFTQEELDAISAEAPTTQAGEMFKARAFEFSERTYLGALGTQAKESYRFALESNIQGAQEDINLTLKRPDLLEETWLRRKESIESASNIGVQNKQAILEKIGPAYANLPIQRDMNEAKIGNYPPEQIVKDIDSGYYEKKAAKLGLKLTPADLQQHRDKAISLSKVRSTDENYQLDKVADNLITDASLTGKVPPEAEFEQFQGKGAAYVSKLKDQVGLVASVSKYNKQIVLDPLGFAKNVLPKLEPKAGSGNSAEQTKIYDALAKTVEQQQKLLQNNPGDAAEYWYKAVSSSNDPSIEKAMLTAISRAGEGKDPTAITFTVNTDPSTGELDTQSQTALKVAYQRSQGIPDQRIEVLGTSRAKLLVDQMLKPNDINPQGSAETVRQQINQMKQVYGKDYFPKAMNELIKAGLPSQYGILTWADDTVLATKIVSTVQTNVKVYEDKVGLPKAQLDSIKENVTQATADYTKALSLGAPNGERNQFINNLNNVIYKLALQQKSVDDKTDVNKFVENSVKTLITDRFSIAGTVVIPKKDAKGKPYDPQTITSRLDVSKRYLTANDISVNYGGSLPANVRKTEVLEVVKDSGYWVTNGNSSGAYLVIDLGGFSAVPVLGADGKRIEKAYKDLNAPTWQGPKGYNSNKTKNVTLPTETYVNPL